MTEKDKAIVKTLAKTKVKHEEEKAKVALVPIAPTMLRPLVSVDEAVAGFLEYQTLKEKIADKGDFNTIKGKKHPTKQFANKLRRFFGLSIEIKDEKKSVSSDGKHFLWNITVRATAPNGQFNDGDGACSSQERDFSNKYHDVRATAVTRAKNRAILELAGFGEVSAEEILEKERSVRAFAKDNPYTEGEYPNGLKDAKEIKEESKPSENDFINGEIVEDEPQGDPATTPSPDEPDEKTGVVKEIKDWLKANGTDEKAFKLWLSDYQGEKDKHYVGKKFNNVSFNAGRLSDLKALRSHLNDAVTKFRDATKPKEESDE